MLDQGSTDSRDTRDPGRLATEFTPIALLLIDSSRTVVFANVAAERLFRFDRGELVGRRIEQLLREDGRRMAVPAAGPSIRPVVPPPGVEGELSGLRKDGTEFAVAVACSRAGPDEANQLVLTLTELAAQKADGDTVEAVLETGTSASLLVEAAGRIAIANRRAERLLGRTRAELVGRDIRSLFPERFRNRLEIHVLRAVRGRIEGGRRRWDALMLHADLQEIPVELEFSAIAANARGYEVRVTIVDAREARSVEASLQFLAALVEDSEDAIISRSVDGLITSWNRAAERLYGYTAAEMLHRPISTLIPERMMADEMLLHERILANERVENYEATKRRKDGTELEVSVTLSPMHDAEGRIIGISSIGRDITEAKRRDAELLRSNAELEQFAYVASHDLQEPLRMVANYTELLAERYAGRLDEKAQRYIHHASDGARRMQRLVNDLLEYSRIGCQDRRPTSVSVDRVISSVIANLSGVITSEAAAIEVGEMPVVSGDEGQLHQLFQNLLSNALKFRSEAPPRIRISARPQGERWHFDVADNGIGIDPKYFDRVFQMFQRLHERGKYAGSGIGLSIAKRIVERHGGRITLASEPGRGSTFSFSLRATTQERP